MFLSHNSSDTPELALLWMFYSAGGPISFSGRVMSRNFEIVSKEVLWSVWGSYQTIWGSPLSNVKRHSGGWPFTVTPSIDETLHQFLTLYWSGPYYRLLSNCVRFPQNICNGCGMPTEDAYSWHLVLSHFGTCMCSNVETNLSWTCLVSGLLSFEHPSVLLFFSLLYLRWIWIIYRQEIWLVQAGFDPWSFYFFNGKYINVLLFDSMLYQQIGGVSYNNFSDIFFVFSRGILCLTFINSNG